MWQQSRSFHQSKIKRISCTFTHYFVLICFDTLSRQFVQPHVSGSGWEYGTHSDLPTPYSMVRGHSPFQPTRSSGALVCESDLIFLFSVDLLQVYQLELDLFCYPGGTIHEIAYFTVYKLNVLLGDCSFSFLSWPCFQLVSLSFYICWRV